MALREEALRRTELHKQVKAALQYSDVLVNPLTPRSSSGYAVARLETKAILDRLTEAECARFRRGARFKRSAACTLSSHAALKQRRRDPTPGSRAAEFRRKETRFPSRVDRNTKCRSYGGDSGAHSISFGCGSSGALALGGSTSFSGFSPSLTKKNDCSISLSCKRLNVL